MFAYLTLLFDAARRAGEVPRPVRPRTAAPTDRRAKCD
jgi:hypothetical protein